MVSFSRQYSARRRTSRKTGFCATAAERLVGVWLVHLGKEVVALFAYGFNVKVPDSTKEKDIELIWVAIIISNKKNTSDNNSNSNNSNSNNSNNNNNSNVHHYDTRRRNYFHLFRVNSTFVRKSVRFSFPVVWNSIPNNISSYKNLRLFKKSLKRYFVLRYWLLIYYSHLLLYISYLFLCVCVCVCCCCCCCLMLHLYLFNVPV